MEILNFDNIEHIYATGDIHGHFNEIPFSIKSQKIQNSLIIFCGDIGFGFASEEFYNQTLKSISRKLIESNNKLIFIRGNHDDPSYFDGKHKWGKKQTNIYAIKDYTVLNVNNQRNILCIGGATSVDRTDRINNDRIRMLWYGRYHNDLENAPKSYWPNEGIVLDTDKIKELAENNIMINTVCTHTCPSFAYPKDKGDFVQSWYDVDPELEQDLIKERTTMDTIYNSLKENNHPVTQWVYGHFHRFNRETTDGCEFLLLDMCYEIIILMPI